MSYDPADFPIALPAHLAEQLRRAVDALETVLGDLRDLARDAPDEQARLELSELAHAVGEAFTFAADVAYRVRSFTAGPGAAQGAAT